MPRRQKIAVRQVNALTRKECVDKATSWSQEYPPNLFSGDKDECKFTHEDLRSSFVAGIKLYGTMLKRNFLKMENGVFYRLQAGFVLPCVAQCILVYINGGSWIIQCMMGKVSNAGLMFKILYYINKIK